MTEKNINKEDALKALNVLKDYGLNKSRQAGDYVADKLKSLRQKATAKVDEEVNANDDVFDVPYELHDLVEGAIDLGISYSALGDHSYNVHATNVNVTNGITSVFRFADNIQAQLEAITDARFAFNTIYVLIADTDFIANTNAVILDSEASRKILALLNNPKFKKDHNLLFKSAVDYADFMNSEMYVVKGTKLLADLVDPLMAD